jgi:hypothetical protein
MTKFTRRWMELFFHGGGCESCDERKGFPPDFAYLKAIPAAYASKEIAEKKADQPVAYCDFAAEWGDEVFCCKPFLLRMLEQCSVDPSIERLS